MSKKLYLLTIVFMPFMYVSNAQIIISTDKASPIEKLFNFENGSPELVHELSDFTILDFCQLDSNHIAISVHSNDSLHEMKMYVIDEDFQIIFESQSAQESYTYSLKTFKSKNEKLIFITAHISNEYSWGNELFLFVNEQVKHLGLIDVATQPFLYEPWDISEYLSIEKIKDEYHFNLNFNPMLYNPGGKKQEVVSPDDLNYIFDGKRLSEKWNNR